MTRAISAVAALSAVLILPGCVAAIGYAVGQAEVERVNQLEKWEASLTRLECEQLDEAYAEMVAEKDDFVDYDQRENIMRTQMEEKACTLPEGLS